MSASLQRSILIVDDEDNDIVLTRLGLDPSRVVGPCAGIDVCERFACRSGPGFDMLVPGISGDMVTRFNLGTLIRLTEPWLSS
jgi:hypothetical protein